MVCSVVQPFALGMGITQSGRGNLEETKSDLILVVRSFFIFFFFVWMETSHEVMMTTM